MAVIAATKTVSFKAPYTGRTFQSVTQQLLGRDGHLSGGEASDDGVNVTIQPVTFVQRGILATTAAALSSLLVPTALEPWFIIGSIPDDHPDSGVIVTITTDATVAAAATVLAFKINGTWQNPESANIAAAALRSSELGAESDLQITPVINGSGDLTSVDVYKGRIVDAAGIRRDLQPNPVLNNAAKIASLTPVRPNPLRARTDYAVLRRRGLTTAIAHVMGGSHNPTGDIGTPSIVALDAVTAPARRPGYFARRGGSLGQQWYSWSDTTSLFIQGGPAGEAFAATALLLGVGNIGTTIIAGQRAADNAVVLLYVDGLSLRLVTFNPTTGAVVSAATSLVADGGQVSHVRAVLDRNEKLHIVYEHDEATQQVRYMRVQIPVGAGFGAVDVAADYVGGAATGTNDTWPTIGVKSDGIVTIAHIQGAGADEFGDLVITELDTTGGLLSQKVIDPTTDVGLDNLTQDSEGLVLTGGGAVPTAFLNVRRTSVVVTPHDEVYVFTVGLLTGAIPKHPLIYNADYQRVLGVELVNAGRPFDPPASTAEITALDACSGEQGEIYLVVKEHRPTPNTGFWVYGLNTRPMLSGRAGIPTEISYLEPIFGVADSSGFNDLLVGRGPTGDVVISYVINTTTTTASVPPIADRLVTPHPSDIYVGSWFVPAAATTLVDAETKQFQVFNTRPKKMNFPFLVGDQGDYQGYGSLAHALEQASQVGGEVILRSGVHQLDGTLTAYSSIRGEGRAVITGTLAALLLYANSDGPNTVSAIAGNVISVDGRHVIRAGSIIEMATSGQHVLLRNLGYDIATDTTKLVLESNRAGVPVGASMTVFAAGLGIENVTFVRTSVGTDFLKLKSAYQGFIRNVRVEAGSGLIKVENCIDAVVDTLDLRNMHVTASPVLRFSTNRGSMISNVKLRDGHGTIQLDADENTPRLVNCGGDGSSPTAPLFSLQLVAGRTTPVYMINCQGKVTGFNVDLAWLKAHVIGGLEITRSSNSAGEVNAPAISVFDRDGNRRVALDRHGLRAGRITEIHQPWIGDFGTVVADRTDIGFWLRTIIGVGAAEIAHSAVLGCSALMMQVTANAVEVQVVSPDIWGWSAIPPESIHVSEFEVDSTNLIGTPALKFRVGYGAASQPDGVPKGHYLEKLPASANWFFITTEDGITRTAIDTGVAVAVKHRVRIEIHGADMPDGEAAYCYLDGILVGVSTTNIDGSGEGALFAYVVATGALNKLFYVGPVTYRSTRLKSDDPI